VASLVPMSIVILYVAWRRGWRFSQKSSLEVPEQESFNKAEMHGEGRPQAEVMGTERSELPVLERSLEVSGICIVHEMHVETR
jgi:hypothetical protein